MRLYERIEFGGQVMELVDDCPNVMDCFHISDIFSCNVTNGNWLFYEQPNYRGRMYLIRPGEYKRFSEWGGRNARVGSIRRIVDDWSVLRDPAWRFWKVFNVRQYKVQNTVVRLSDKDWASQILLWGWRQNPSVPQKFGYIISGWIADVRRDLKNGLTIYQEHTQQQ